MRIVVADEISPDSCRLWDIKSNDKLDKDRFRRDMGGLVEAYSEVARRLGISAPISDPQGLPALIVTVSLVSFLATPLSATMSRHFEAEADDYSLTHVNEPDGMSTALVKTADYRNPRPGRLEEILFYDHPSVESRVRNAMAYKAAHPAATLEPASAPTR